jgi:hypothetical protein
MIISKVGLGRGAYVTSVAAGGRSWASGCSDAGVFHDRVSLSIHAMEKVP